MKWVVLVLKVLVVIALSLAVSVVLGILSVFAGESFMSPPEDEDDVRGVFILIAICFCIAVISFIAQLLAWLCLIRRKADQQDSRCHSI